MTTGPEVSRLQNTSLLGIGAGLVAGVAAIFVGKLLGLTDTQTTLVMPFFGAVPPAIELQIKSRRRNKNVDIARIQRGDLRRPVGLVVMLLTAAILVLDTAAGAIPLGIGELLYNLISAGKIDVNTAKVVAACWGSFPLIVGMCIFLVASYASHYFAKRPYLWTATAVGCALAVRELVVLSFASTSVLPKSAIEDTFGSLPGFVVAEVLMYLGILFICMVAAWLGTRYHDAFLTHKLERMQAKAASEAAKQHQSPPQSQTTATQASAQDSNAPQNSAPKLVTVASRPNDLPSAPDNHRTSDPIKQIERLAHLRDANALTEEEFQAKKAEILCRI